MTPRTTKSLADLLGNDVPKEGATSIRNDENPIPGSNEPTPPASVNTTPLHTGAEKQARKSRQKSAPQPQTRNTIPPRLRDASETSTTHTAPEAVPIGPNAEWIHLEPKTARFYPGQYAWLTEKRKELNRLRAARGKRITENTLLRIAVDLLIHERGDDLYGITENELRESVGLDPVKSLAVGE